MTREEKFLEDLKEEVKKARDKFPGNDHQMNALTEEVGELSKALLQMEERDAAGNWKSSSPEVYKEAVQVAAMALRVALDGDKDFPEYTPGATLFHNADIGYFEATPLQEEDAELRVDHLETKSLTNRVIIDTAKERRWAFEEACANDDFLCFSKRAPYLKSRALLFIYPMEQRAILKEEAANGPSGREIPFESLEELFQEAQKEIDK